MDRLSTAQTRSLMHQAFFNQTRPTRRVDCLASFWNIGGIFLSQGHNRALPSQGNEQRVDIFVVPN